MGVGVFYEFSGTQIHIYMDDALSLIAYLWRENEPH
jgi:hypothetical protein